MHSFKRGDAVWVIEGSRHVHVGILQDRLFKKETVQ